MDDKPYKPLTPEQLEQYMAKAMLLGMWYGHKTHCFFDNDMGGSDIRIDADTLLPVTGVEAHRRLREYRLWTENQMP